MSEVSTPFPVARAEQEFRELSGFVSDYCGVFGHDAEAFRRSVLPFGPLDIDMSKANAEEKQILKGMYLGLMIRHIFSDRARRQPADRMRSVS